MCKVAKALGVVLVSICVAFAEFADGSVPVRHLFDFKMEPVSQLKKGQPASMQLTFSPQGYSCGSTASILVTTSNATGKLDEKSWELELTEDPPYSTTFELTIPKNDTVRVQVKLRCGRAEERFRRWFVTTGDSIEYSGDNPWRRPRPPSASETDDPIRDTLTQEHLQAEYEVLLDLRDSTRRRIAEKILGPMPESSKSDLCDACHVLRVSLENLLKLVDEGIKFEFTTPPPWSRRYRAPNDSVLQPQSPPPPKPPKADDIDVDTLTPEQLQSEHEVMLWFRDSTERNLVEQLVGPMQDSLRLHGRWSVFRVKMTLEKFLEIRKHKVDVHLLNPGQWWRQTPQDSVPQQRPQDTAKSQGVLDQLPEGAYPGSVWAVGDDNSWNGYDYWGDVTCRARGNLHTAGVFPDHHCHFTNLFS